MATAEQVKAEVSGQGNHHRLIIFPGTAYEVDIYSIQSKVTETARELLRHVKGTEYDVNRPGSDPSKRPSRGLWDAVMRILFEVTFWVPRRSVAELKAARGVPDTVLGHARDAASYGDVNYRILERIAEKVGVDISDIK